MLVGTATSDDAGIYRLSDETALVQTVDFFTPIVDDPYDFGAIAAANALSDVYAMGGRPITALAIGAFPEELGADVVARILLGGAETAARAGVSIVGGHTIKDDEPKYGLAVTGVIHPDRIVRNDTGQPGDALILTKPLGTGILATARRIDAIDDPGLTQAVDSMKHLNARAAEEMLRYGARAATDVTGFGLLGHLFEMLQHGLGARIDATSVPVFADAVELAARNIVPGGTRTNLATAIERGALFDEGVSNEMRTLLADAQTSGGLLIAIAQSEAPALLKALHASDPFAAQIGNLDASGTVEVTTARGKT